MPGSSPSARILVLARINGVGSVPSIQMYSARYGTDVTLYVGRPWRGRRSCAIGRTHGSDRALPRHRPLPCARFASGAVSRPLPDIVNARVNWAGPGRGAVGPPCQDGAAMEHQQDYVLRTVEERGVRLVRLWFTDVLGQLKSVAISPAELENAFEEGMHFDGSAIDGFSRVQESDVLAMPDPNSFELLPWAKTATTPRPACSATSSTSTAPPFEGDPRQVLKRNLDAGPDAGLLVLCARPRWSSSTSPTATRRHAPEPLDSGSLLRPHHLRRGQRPPQAHHPHARGHGHPRRVLLPRGRAPASTRSTCATPTRCPWPTTS